MLMRRWFRREVGFTLVELLVVIAIAGIVVVRLFRLPRPMSSDEMFDKV
jgi:prepilin-type N-terminal cleavage/methylation domain-containing protein